MLLLGPLSGFQAGEGNAAVARLLVGWRRQGDKYEQHATAGYVRTRVVRQDKDWTVFSVVSNLTQRITYHWWLNGGYAGATAGGRRAFRCAPGSTIVVVCRPVKRASFDIERHAPLALTGILPVHWLKSSDDVSEYLVQYRIVAGTWATFAKVKADARWEYQVATPQLADSTAYEFQVIPVDMSGNEGTALNLGTETVARWPDSVNLTVTYSSGTSKFTFTDAG